MAKTYLITGGSSGFGRLLAEKLLARGDRVAVTVRQERVLDDLKAQYDGRLWIAILDLTHTDAVRGVIDRAFDELGRIDVVVSNAGYGLFGAAEEVTNEQVRHQIDTNLLGSIAVIGPAYAICALRAADACCRFLRKADRSPIRDSVSIMRPSGA
jgi:NAD(P)-dependent dehydrogenase (short-subunit alcohol dehydrogenase family)